MTQNINQFSLTNQQGQLVNTKDANGIISVIIDPASTADFVAGSAVKVINKTGGYGLPVVEKCAATDIADGFILLSQQKSTFAAGDIVEIAGSGNEIYMVTGAAINGGALVEYVPASDTIITSAGTNKIVGKNMIYTASGSLARLKIVAPNFNQL